MRRGIICYYGMACRWFKLAPNARSLISFSTSTPLSEPEGRITTVLGGHADDPNWNNDINQTGSAAMESARQNCSLPVGHVYTCGGINWHLVVGQAAQVFRLELCQNGEQSTASSETLNIRSILFQSFFC